MNLLLTGYLHLYESNVPVESGYLLEFPNNVHPNNLNTGISFPEDTMFQSHTTSLKNIDTTSYNT